MKPRGKNRHPSVWIWTRALDLKEIKPRGNVQQYFTTCFLQVHLVGFGLEWNRSRHRPSDDRDHARNGGLTVQPLCSCVHQVYWMETTWFLLLLKMPVVLRTIDHVVFGLLLKTWAGYHFYWPRGLTKKTHVVWTRDVFVWSFSTHQVVIVDIMLGHYVLIEKPMSEGDKEPLQFTSFTHH